MSIKKFMKSFIDVYPSYINPFNYAQKQHLNAGFTIANIHNQKIKYSLKNLNEGSHTLEGTIDPKSHVNVDLKLDYDKINPSELNNYKFEIQATPYEASTEEGAIQNADVNISCLPRKTSPGQYDARIKYDINSGGF
mmetsp:Transcript_24566/g.21744  ORF Transcript_24566/g.21744 Transcript_24566/m.21744 type:complete len:137 (+) Transcript_24566:39-449(+)